MPSDKQVWIDYTNWRGERRVRRIVPEYVDFGSNEHHPDDQWMLVAWDPEKGERRTFAMKDIHSWKAQEPAGVALPAVPAMVPAGQVVAWMWQHEETGNVGFIDQWQIDNGWQAANPRLRLIRPLVFTAGVKGLDDAQP